jgi:hypothetical protein
MQEVRKEIQEGKTGDEGRKEGHQGRTPKEGRKEIQEEKTGMKDGRKEEKEHRDEGRKAGRTDGGTHLLLQKSYVVYVCLIVDNKKRRRHIFQGGSSVCLSGHQISVGS